MKSASFPSKIASIVDLPEPTNLYGEFVYNFFTQDESTNPGSGYPTFTVDITNSANLSRVPRYNTVSFSPVILKGCNADPDDDIKNTLEPNFITSNIPRMKSETTFSNFDFVGLDFQDLNIDGKLYEMLRGSLTTQGISPDSIANVGEEITNLFQDLEESDFLRTVQSGYQYCGIFFRPPTRNNTNVSLIERLKNVKITTQINNKVARNITKSIVEDSFGLYSEEAYELLPQMTKIQDFSRRRSSNGNILENEWDAGFDEIIRKPDLNLDVVNTKVDIIGYLVEAYEIVNGQEVLRKKEILKGKNNTNYTDIDVIYGKTYTYKIKAVAGVRIDGLDENDEPTLFYGFVTSRPSKRVIVKSFDMTPPRPPADFKPTWDFTFNKLRLMWSFPVNPTNDVKRFQIFRRKSIREPFELLQEYDFDDSNLIYQRGERIPAHLINNMVGNPITYFYDPDFNKDSKFIYALTSIDAHGLSSNFTMQYEVTFDRFKNKLMLELISRSGAPKAYPNAFLEVDSFQDAIKVSGYEKFKIYFNPDYLKLKSYEGEDLDFIPLEDPNGKIKIQIINVDRQKGKTIDIEVKDLRPYRNLNFNTR